jgi:hypothetical protein
MEVSMNTSARKVAIRLLLGLSLIGLVPGAATATTPWSTGCNIVANQNYLCNFSDRDFKGVWGHVTFSISDYSGYVYNSGTSISVNNTTSSVANLYSNKDVSWSVDTSQNGDGLCLNPNISASWVGLWINDAFSSHEVAADNSAC